ncbi:MAG: hypothetical protein AB1476_05840 [Candidatus Hadarchaeota archaeon]
MAEKTLKKLPKEFPVPSDVKLALEKISGPLEKGFYEKFCGLAGRVFGGLVGEPKISDQTVRAMKEAGIRVTPKEWTSGMFFSVLVPALPLLLIWLVLTLLGGDIFGLLYLPLLALLVGGLGMMLFQSYPSSRAASLKSEAQGKAINTIMLLSFSLHHRPDIRGATVYAADTSEGKLAEDLQKGLLEMDERRKYETVRHLLTAVANEWGRLDESTRQAIFDILRSTGTKEEAARIADVSKAPARVLEGAEEQLTRRLNSLVMPTLAFLTFGSLAIIGTVGLSPVFTIIGMQLVDIKFFIGMSAALIMAFFLFTLYMGGRRPVTIQPPAIPDDDPRLPPKGKVSVFGKLLPSWLPPVLVFSALVWPGILHLLGVTSGVLGIIAMSLSTFWLVWAAAAAIAVHAYLASSSRAKIRDEERRKLSDWGNALNTMGSRMLDGKPAAQAMAEASEMMEGSPLAGELKEASVKMERLGIGLHEAIFSGGRRHNPLIESFLKIISRVRSGSEAAAGRACMMAAELLGTLHRVERRFRERIDEAMGNLWLVAVVLIPVVCAMSVWVMDFMSGMRFTIAAKTAVAGVTGIPFLLGVMGAGELAVLRLVMGVTAMLLSIIIARYIASIKASRDRVELWSAVMKSTLVSTAIFTATSFLLGMVTVGGV